MSEDCRFDLPRGLWRVGSPPGTDGWGFPHPGCWIHLRAAVAVWCDAQGITYAVEQPTPAFWKAYMGGGVRGPIRCTIVFNRPEYKVMFLMRWKGATI